MRRNGKSKRLPPGASAPRPPPHPAATMCCISHPAGSRSKVLANYGAFHITVEVVFGFFSLLLLAGAGVMASVLCVVGAAVVTCKGCGKDYHMAVSTCT